MTITWAHIMWVLGLLSGWTGLLLGGIKYLLNRQIAAFEARLAEADAKASKALAAFAACEKAVADDISAIRLEISNKQVCANHDRMEHDNKDQFVRLDTIGRDIGEIKGTINGLKNSIDLLLQHHIKGN